MKKHIKFPLIIAAVLLYNNAYAVGAVSRACRFSDIPSTLQVVAANFFKVVGGDVEEINRVLNADSGTQSYWHTFEALTTDYVETRYYLFAQADVYQIINANPAVQYVKTYSSPGWEDSEISDAMKADDRFKVYYANRGPLYSARAGNPRIIEYMSYHPFASSPFMVEGHHKHYDIGNKVPINDGITKAKDCNLNNFGVTHSGIFDR